ncbi:hypothetical protein CBR_g30690 [Chara braunii]|uniref:Programmed cell death protein 2 C-terminal domain-containing protein n=1 Tax=Chara braunii TaxID=69332 RepID=A0A388LDN5_CHABU|nr:hypothetical protein CBR_g30690 [Chara braunii]|eukprot:GBG80322.1 hypothetical protein CBR_g30690 [Chara braunii]
MMAIQQLGPVLLGLPGAWSEDPLEECDRYTTKVGGVAGWPEGFKPQQELLCCRVCGHELALVVQAYAPLPHGSNLRSAERTLYLYGCLQKGCGSKPLCWRVLRVQRLDDEGAAVRAAATQGLLDECTGHRTQMMTTPENGTANCRQAEVGGNAEAGELQPNDNQLVDAPGVTTNQIGESSQGGGDNDNLWEETSSCSDPVPVIPESIEDFFGTSGGAEDWVVDVGPWDFGAKVVQEGSKAFDLDELSAAIEAAGKSAATAKEGSGKKSKKKKQQEALQSTTRGPAPIRRPAECGDVLPCFYVYSEDEPSVSGRPEKGVGTGGTACTSTMSCEPADKGSTAENAGVQEEAWGAEDYEYDKALSVGRDFLKFKKRLDRAPEQCLRYQRNGHLIWPSSQLPTQIADCETCGEPRVFEMQLMPPLLYFLQEAVRTVDHQYPESIADFDWLTVAVFTCSQSCAQRSGQDVRGLGLPEWGVFEEACAVFREA